MVGVEGDFEGWTVQAPIHKTALTEHNLTAHSKWGVSLLGTTGICRSRSMPRGGRRCAFVSNETSIPTTGIYIWEATARERDGQWAQASTTPFRTTGLPVLNTAIRNTSRRRSSIRYQSSISGLVGYKQELRRNNQINARIGYKF